MIVSMIYMLSMMMMIKIMVMIYLLSMIALIVATLEGRSVLETVVHEFKLWLPARN